MVRSITETPLRQRSGGGSSVRLVETATNNLFCGSNSGIGINGTESAAFGIDTVSIDSGDRNSIFGYCAANKLDAGGSGGYDNTYVGWKAGEGITANNEGYQNVGVGSLTMRGMTTGYWNVGIGYKTLTNILSGFSNMAIGYLALDALSTGSSNVAIGAASIKRLTTGEDNVGLGAETLSNVITGKENIAIGISALANYTGSFNTAVGGLACQSVTGVGNTGIGSRSLRLSGTGRYNTAVGYTALERNYIGDRNTSVGYESGRRQNGGSGNTYIGYRAGRGAADYVTDGCVLIGNDVGYSNTTNNRLMIDNSNTVTPLLDGDFSARSLKIHGDLYQPSDTTKHFWGAGNDISIGYDGTDANINTGLVSPSDMVVDCGTNKTIELTQAVTDDVQIDIGSVKLPPSSAATIVLNPAADVGLAIEFENAKTQSVHFNMQSPHARKDESDIDLHLHVTPGASTNTGNVRMQLDYDWQNIDGTYGGATTVYATFAMDGTAHKHQYEDLVTISGTGMSSISSIICCKLTRLGSDALDTFTGDIYAVGIDFHVVKDTIGSRQDLAK